MILLVSGATATIRKHAHSSHLGRLIQPRNGNDVAEIALCGLPGGADNDALQGVDPDALLAMWDRLAAHNGDWLKFVTPPDAVEMTNDGPHGDWGGTLWLFKSWLPALQKRALPAAIVAQDGATVSTVPWSDIRALFIGGSTAWKLSDAAEVLIRAASKRGKWVHVGRVNSMQRLAHFDPMPVNSLDGGQFSMFPDTYIPRYLERLKHRQLGMFVAGRERRAT